MGIIRILDIDLDFFLDCNNRPRQTIEREDNNLQVWKRNDIINFLEKNCGLNPGNPLNGQVFNHHHEAYHFCKTIVDSDPSVKFVIDHVDAHADLGFGDSSWMNLFTDERIMFESGWIGQQEEIEYGLNPGNFLLFFLAQGWLQTVNYINHPHLLYSDLNDLVLFEENKNLYKLEIRHFEKQSPIARDKSSQTNKRRVPFHTINYMCFNNCHEYDYIFVTRSPDYTPVQSDDLIPIFQQYFQIEK